MAIEALEEDQAQRLAAASPVVAAAVESAAEAQKPARRALPDHLPREDVSYAAPCACPSCGGSLRRIGEDVTETLDYVARPLQGHPAYPGEAVVPGLRHRGGGAGTRSCDCPRPRWCRAVGAYRRLEVRRPLAALPAGRDLRARGVTLETSTLSGWVGAIAAALQPLVDALAGDVMASDSVHVDDTPVPVLAPGTGKTKTRRLWTYIRDERPFAGKRPPAALFFYSPDRKGEHPRDHLKAFYGTPGGGTINGAAPDDRR